jgi:dUTP pyrophosphatase
MTDIFPKVIKFKKLHPNVVIPKYANSGDAGLDLIATEVNWVKSNHSSPYYECKTGLAIEIPQGYVGLLFPRSSISKMDMFLCNAVGVIDSSYRGEVMLRFKDPAIEGEPNYYQVGDKVAQLIILPYPQVHLQEVEELSSTERDSGGFGSTGN